MWMPFRCPSTNSNGNPPQLLMDYTCSSVGCTEWEEMVQFMLLLSLSALTCIHTYICTQISRTPNSPTVSANSAVSLPSHALSLSLALVRQHVHRLFFSFSFFFGILSQAVVCVSVFVCVRAQAAGRIFICMCVYIQNFALLNKFDYKKGWRLNLN